MGTGPIVYYSDHASHYLIDFLRAASRELPLIALFSGSRGFQPFADPDFGVCADFECSTDGVDARVLPPLFGSGPVSTDVPLLHSSVVDTIRSLCPSAVIVSRNNLLCHWQVILAVQRLGIPLLLRTEATSLFFHGSRLSWPLRRLILRWLSASAAGVLSIGTRCSEFYRATGVPESRIFHVPYAVDNERLLCEAELWAPMRKETLNGMGLDPHLPTIVFSGKLIERKRPFDLVDVLRKLVAAGRPANLIIIGDGPLRIRVERALRESGLYALVHITGFLSPSSLSRYYACGDVFLLPSAQETWGLVVNEAMCFGMPVIVSRMVGAAIDLVANGVNGAVVELGDTEAMASEIARLLSDPVQRAREGKASVSRIKAWGFSAGIEGMRCAMAALDIHA